MTLSDLVTVQELHDEMFKATTQQAILELEHNKPLWEPFDEMFKAHIDRIGRDNYAFGMTLIVSMVNILARKKVQ